MAKTVKVADLTELLNAIATIEEDDTIKLESNITADCQLVFNTTCVVDLNEFKLHMTVAEGFLVRGGTKVTVRNGSVTSVKDDMFTVTDEGSVLTIADRLKVYSSTSIIWAKNNAKVIVDGACIISDGTYSTAFIDGEGASGDFLSGTIKCMDETVITVKSGGTAFIGGKMQVVSECSQQKGFCAVYSQGKSASGRPSVIIITGFAHIHSEHTCALAVTGGSQCSIESGKLCSKSVTQPTIALEDPDSVLRIIGGKITSYGEDAIRVFNLQAGQSNTLDVVGGKIYAEAGQVVRHVGDGEPNISVIGIEFKGELDPKYLPPGYVIVDGKIYPEDEAPEPEPEPDPDPDPDPEPEPEPEPKPIEIGDSIGLTEPINIYIGPSLRAYSNRYVGSVLVVAIRLFDAYDREFLGVEYKVPGSGNRLFGFVLRSDLERIVRY